MPMLAFLPHALYSLSPSGDDPFLRGQRSIVVPSFERVAGRLEVRGPAGARGFVLVGPPAAGSGQRPGLELEIQRIVPFRVDDEGQASLSLPREALTPGLATQVVFPGDARSGRSILGARELGTVSTVTGMTGSASALPRPALRSPIDGACGVTGPFHPPRGARRRALVQLVLSGLGALLPSCGGGGSGGTTSGENFVLESSSNDSVAEATRLPLGLYGLGDLSDRFDADYWRVSLSANAGARIEVLAARLDPDGWNAEGSAPMVGILEANGTFLRVHEPRLRLTRPNHDLDFPLWIVPESGEYLVRLARPVVGGGAYALRVTEESVPDLVHELEPVGMTGQNNTPGTAETIPSNVTMACWTDSDRDQFSFELFEESIVTLEVWSARYGYSLANDDYVFMSAALHSPTDSHPGGSLASEDVGLSVRLPAGTQIVDLAPQGAGDQEYLFRLRSEPCGPAWTTPESEPNDDLPDAEALLPGALVAGSVDGGPDLFSFFGEAGDLIDFEVRGERPFTAPTLTASLVLPGSGGFPSVNGPHLQRVGAQPRETGVHYLSLSGSGSYVVRLRDPRSAAFEMEPNDTLSQAGTFTDGRASGAILVPGDVDVFAVTARANRLHRLRLRGSLSSDTSAWYGSFLVPRVTIFDGTGTLVAAESVYPSTTLVHPSGAADPGVSLSLAFVPTTTGLVYVQVEDAQGGGDDFRTYQLEFE